MVDSHPLTSTRLVRVSMSVVLAAALGLMASCGSDTSADKKDTKSSQVKGLEKLPKFLQDDFRAGDTDHDGRIEDAELKAMVEEDFKASDLDKDGEITEKDVQKELGKNADATASLKQMDINKDGRVPLDEYAQHVERDFMKDMDTNKDGDLDPPEVAKFYEAQYKARAKK
jgi:Ca2+-binding EF-hand superfamily protein